MKEKKLLHVLLVDDQPDFLEPISFLLKSNGYDVSLASNGKQAIDIIRLNTPDIVFLDIQMPEMNGIEALENIRKISKDLPVVMLTGHPDEENQAEAKRLGVSGFFTKRGNVWQLPSIIETILKERKKRETETP